MFGPRHSLNPFALHLLPGNVLLLGLTVGTILLEKGRLHEVLLGLLQRAPLRRCTLGCLELHKAHSLGLEYCMVYV